jgi:hypothetical protein
MENIIAYEMDSRLGSALVRLLADKKETLASLSGPRCEVMGSIHSLVSLEGADGLEVNRLGSEPEELLGVDEVPMTS